MCPRPLGGTGLGGVSTKAPDALTSTTSVAGTVACSHIVLTDPLQIDCRCLGTPLRYEA